MSTDAVVVPDGDVLIVDVCAQLVGMVKETPAAAAASMSRATFRSLSRRNSDVFCGCFLFELFAPNVLLPRALAACF